MQPEVLKTAADHLNTLPILRDINLWWTRPHDEYVGVQNYHIDDIAGTKSLRFLISLTDVDENCGPLHALAAKPSRELVRKTGYLGGTLSPEYLSQECDKSLISSFTGAIGTGVAVDAGNCFHFGSRNMAKDRLVLSISFSTCTLFEDVPSKYEFIEEPASLKSYEHLVIDRHA